MSQRRCLDCPAKIPATERRCERCARGKTRRRAARDWYQSIEWEHLRAAAIARDEHCQACRSTDRLTPHHVIARGDGGADELWNLVVLCGSCHSQLEADQRARKQTPLVLLVLTLGAALRLPRGGVGDDAAPHQ